MSKTVRALAVAVVLLLGGAATAHASTGAVTAQAAAVGRTAPAEPCMAC